MPVHTDLPIEEHSGELWLARRLAAMDNDGYHLWFNVSWLPGVGEVDLIIWRNKGGLFVCEVKSFGIAAIESFSHARLKLRASDREMAPPHLSIDGKRWKLHNQIQPKLSRRLPFSTPVVIWTAIDSEDWRSAFQGDIGGLAERMIFADDLLSAERFDAALRRVASNPATGAAPTRGLTPLDDDRQRTEFASAVLPGAQSPRTKRTDLEKLRLLEGKVAAQVLPDAPVDTQSRVIYRGGPGTGKTFRLLQLGVNHVIAGRSVMYVCFNKTLAADIGRLFSLIPEVRAAPQFPWIWDVADLLKHISNMLNLDLRDVAFSELKDWCALVQAELKLSATIDLATFDLVAIDEVQDMESWMLDFATGFCSPSGSVAMAEGIGQQLYGGPGEQLGAFRNSASVVELVRNFRNTEPTYRVAAQMHRWAAHWGEDEPGSTGEPSCNLFDRQKGHPPRLEILYDRPGESDPKQAVMTMAHERNMVTEYRRVVSEEIESLFQHHESTDLLILVPTDTSHERRWAHEAIESLGIPFVDYTRTRNNTAKWMPFVDDRRRAPEGDMLRLCTYRSSRGLEGTRVLVFGLERALEVSRSLQTHADSLLHVVLSRALIDCVVAMPASAQTQERSALEQAIATGKRR